MVVNTRLFGSIDLEEEKIITFEQGIIGFEELKKFAILYDLDSKEKGNVSWLQSLDEPQLAFPIINPFLVKGDYNPEIEDEILQSLGEVKEDNVSVLVTLAVPRDVKKMTCNLRAPFVINTDTRKGTQVILDNVDYPVKFYIYDIIMANRQEKEEC